MSYNYQNDKRNDETKYGYTTVQHDPRLKFGLSNDSYCIADAIYNLSNNPKSIAPGWCYASRQTIADLYGISKRTVQRSIVELTKKKLIEVDSATKFVRTTQFWYDEFVQYQLKNRGDKMS